MSITDLIEIPQNINHGLSSARQRTMLALLGNPRGNYDQTCKPVTNPSLIPLFVTDNIGDLSSPLYVDYEYYSIKR